VSSSAPWPELPYEQWEPSKQTLHRYAQMVGKVRMALTPSQNHWWHVTLYVTERGLTTGPMPYGILSATQRVLDRFRGSFERDEVLLQRPIRGIALLSGTRLRFANCPSLENMPLCRAFPMGRPGLEPGTDGL
jgi:hypothetical protein